MRKKCSGFSLIELMAVIAIVGIAAAIGMPSMVGVINRTRLESELSSLEESLNLGRSEAVKRGVPVSVCPSTDGATCSTGTNWSSGWIVLLNSSPTQVLQKVAALSSDTLTSIPSGSTNYPQYTAMGYTFYTGTLTLHDSQSTASSYQCVTFTAGSWVANVGSACP
jgi:type IV fimbrial biogenesis protein FimT